MDLKQFAIDAIEACHGKALCRPLGEELSASAREVHLLAAGKAARAMAGGLLEGMRGRVVSGLVISKDDHGEVFPSSVVAQVAGHPVPDERSVAAAAAVRSLVERVGAEQVLAVALSGGASSLLCEPAQELSLLDLATTTRVLLGAGHSIREVNIVRKHLTRVSGGRMAAACQGRVELVAISDVLDDDWGTIGSGPFASDPSTYAEALAIVHAEPDINTVVKDVLKRGVRGELAETIKGDHPCFQAVRCRVLASHQHLRQAAVDAARAAGVVQVRQLSEARDSVESEASRLGAHVATLRPGELLVGGGEPTVVLPRPAGKGGRSQQLALLMARCLAAGPPARFLAVGSDGSDGPTDAAGAMVDHHSWGRMCDRGDPERAIHEANAYPLLGAIGALVRTGPTGTNVLDLHLMTRLA